MPKKLLAKLHQEVCLNNLKNQQKNIIKLDKISIAIKDEFPNCIHDILEIN